MRKLLIKPILIYKILFLLTISNLNFGQKIKKIRSKPIKTTENSDSNKSKNKEQISYLNHTLDMPDPKSHYFEVTTKIPIINENQLKQNYVDFKMASWTPGSYLIREYAKNVEQFRAFSNNESLKSMKINKNTWRVFLNNSESVTINYLVYAFELTVRTSFLDDSHGFVVPASMFMYVDAQKDMPIKLTVNPHTSFSQISTGLSAIPNEKNSFLASNLDILIDSPIEIGTQKLLQFEANNIPHTVAMYGKAEYDETKLLADYKRVCEASTTVVGENPLKDYTFIVHNVQNGGGGLEHLNSTTLQTSRSSYLNPDRYRSFFGLVAHEYFHLWNVKRVRPIAFGPFDYENENYSSMIWFSEGCTSYYGENILLRSKLISSNDYLKSVSNDISNLENTPGNRVESATEASFDAWIKYYRQNENSRNSQISYYDKGSVLGLVLNLMILTETKGKASLDNLMRVLYQKYYKKLDRGFKDDEFKMELEGIVGKSLNNFFESYVSGTKTLPYNGFFNGVGYQLVDENEGNQEAYLGAVFAGFRVASVIKNSPAYHAGLNVKDELISINNEKVEDIKAFLAKQKPGDTLNLSVKRDGLTREFSAVTTSSPLKKYNLVKLKKTSPEQDALASLWLFQ